MSLRLIPHVHRATHRIGLHVERLGGAAVTQAEAHILAHLAAEGEATIGDVHRAFARELCLQHGTTLHANFVGLDPALGYDQYYGEYGNELELERDLAGTKL